MTTSACRSIALGLLLSACGVGATQPPAGDDDDDAAGPDAAPPPAGDAIHVSGPITASDTWAGDVLIDDSATIMAGVEITIAAGTRVAVNDAKFLTVAGTLVADGADGDLVHFGPMQPSGGWGGIKVASGGRGTLRFVEATRGSIVFKCESDAAECAVEDSHIHDVGRAVEFDAPGRIERSSLERMANGGVTIEPGADAVITDSYIHTSEGDLVVVSGGSLTIEHSEIGYAVDSYEHCGFHINAADGLTVTHNRIVSNVYSFMIGNVDGAVVQYNNISEDTTHVDDMGGVADADFRFNYWDDGAPSLGQQIDTSAAAADPYDDAGPST